MNAGAYYLDELVMVDRNLITSKKPNDLPDFCKAITKALVQFDILVDIKDQD